MNYYVFRNFTIEHIFDKNMAFSSYNVFITVPENIDSLMWFYFVPPKITAGGIRDQINNYLDKIVQLFIMLLYYENS